MLFLIVLLIIAGAAGAAGLLVNGLFWLFIVALCVAVGAIIVSGVWGWLERRRDNKDTAATT